MRSPAIGVHATVAGAVLGLLAPVAGAERIDRFVHPFTSLAVVPLFALANAGVVLATDALESPGGLRIALGVVLGLVVGKLIGVTGAAWLAVRLGIGSLPAGVGWSQVAGIAAWPGSASPSRCSYGLAFTTPAAESAAKLGVLVASGLASVVGTVVLLATSARRLSRAVRASPGA